MNTCEHYQSQLFSLLYGLLDEDERRELTSHLSDCAGCRAALDAAEAQKGLLAVAAKTEFSEVRFLPPAEAVPAPASVVPFRRPKVRHFRRWALAASVLVLLSGSGFFGVWGWQQRRGDILSAEGRLAAAQNSVAELQRQQQAERQKLAQEMRAVQEEIKRLTDEWRNESDKVTRSVKGRGVRVNIEGPKNLQAGAKNLYHIDVRRDNQAPANVKELTTQVIEPDSKKVLFEKTIANQGQVNIDLPPSLPVRPGTQLALVVKAKSEDGIPFQITEQLPLVGPQYLTHLTTDRPMYRPGEVVHFRSLTLERFSLLPPQDELSLIYRVSGPNNAEIFKTQGAAQMTAVPGGEAIKGPDGKALRGVGAGEVALAPNLPGGEYTLTVSEANSRFPPEKRKFLVNNYQAPRLNKELEFTRKSYGPGERVEITGKVTRVEGGMPMAHQPVLVSMRVDTFQRQFQSATDRDGNVKVSFDLPATIDKGEGSVSLQFNDGGNVETFVRPIPIVLNKLLVDFYPEGGELVAGLTNRVYFEVRNNLGKPAELNGRIVDQAGKEVAKIQTLSDDQDTGVNQGMGAFELVPQVGAKYELKIDTPIGIKGPHTLPAVKADGVVLHIPQGVVRDSIDVALRSGGRDRRLIAGAYCRGRLLDQSPILTVKKGEAAALKLHTAEGVSGVYRVTVFEVPDGADQSQLVPVAERLVYRRAVEQLNFNIAMDKQDYAPGDPVKVTLRSADEKNQAKPAVLLVSVVDQRILKLADEKTAHSLPTHFLLATEVKKAEDLENADFLIGAHPKAEVALDLLLGTQGWRRFAEQDPRQFQLRQKQDAQRLLMVNGQEIRRTETGLQQNVNKVDLDYSAKFVQAQRKLGQKERVEENLNQEEQVQRGAANASVQRAHTDREQAKERLAEYQKVVGRIALGVLVFALLGAGIAGLAIGLMRLSKGQEYAAPFLATGIGMLAFLFMGSLVGTFLLLGDRGQDRFGFFNGGGVGMKAQAPVAAGPMMAVEEKAADMAMPDPQPDIAPGFNPAERAMPKMPPMPGAPGMAGPANAPVMLQMEGAGPGMPVPMVGPVGGAGGFPAAPGFEMGGRMEGGPGMGGMPGQMGQGRGDAFGGFAQADRFFRPQDERFLRLRGNFPELIRRQLGRPVNMAPVLEPFVVREYAHGAKGDPDGVRHDFAETLYWHPVLVLADGKGDINFNLSHSTTRFQVLVTGHALDGRLGAATLEFASRLPYSIEPKVPTEITNTDKVMIPVTVANDTNRSEAVSLSVRASGLLLVQDAEFEVKGGLKPPGGQPGEAPMAIVPPGQAGFVGGIEGPMPGVADRILSIEAGKRERQLFTFHALKPETEAKLRFTGGFGNGFTDSVDRSFKVVPDGFPVIGSQSDMLEKAAVHTFNLPQWLPGTLKCEVQVYPTALADLQKGLEALLREPGGCFEQSSSSNYPNVMILSYLKETQQANPTVEERSRQLLTSGYSKLTSFECLDPKEQAKRKGYEWFGGAAPPHEALTAYGLLQFRDMAKVHPVEKEMMERTRQYLLSQRDGEGGFKRNPRALDTFGRAPQHITNAYIVWALTESGEQEDLEKELALLQKQAKDSKDPYFLALVGNSLLNRSKGDDALALLKRLTELQKNEGYLQGTETSITGSSGRDLQIETTALSVLGWIKANRPADFQVSIKKAVDWIGKQRGGYGGFGATQSTVLALKALIAYTSKNKQDSRPGQLKLFVNNRPEPVDTRDYPKGISEPLVLTVPQIDLLKAGENKVRIEDTAGNVFPYTLAWSYRTLKPVNPEGCPVRVAVSLDKPAAKEGETVHLKTVVENKSGQGQGMAVAVVGLPGGLALPEDFRQLKDLARLRNNDTERGVIDAWELRGRELVLYWRDLRPDQKIEVDLDVICRIPGEYRGPASRAYLYYNADRKFWTDPVAITIQPQ
jgi:hypothetical protein